jgi:cyanophycin synthetase
VPDHPEASLRIVDARVLRGPNYWAREPVVRMLVDLGTLEHFPSNLLPGFTDALVELLPSLDDHACSLGRRGGFISRLRDGTWAGHIAEHVALELQNLSGTDVRHGKTRGAGPVGRYNVIYEYREESVGLEAGRIAVDLVNHLVDPTASPDFDLLAELERLIRLAERSAFGPSTQALIDEAVSRDIPYIRLDRYSLVQLGQGVHQQRIRATMTSRTSGIAVDIASDKSLTNKLLDSAGLPVPRSEVVDTEDDAVVAARKLGYPCVLKPLDGNHGRGVHLDLRSEEDVRAAAATSSSRPTCTATTTGCSSSAGGSRRSPSGFPRRSSATGSTPCASSSTSPTPTHAGASATRRSSPGSRSTRRPRRSSAPRASSSPRSPSRASGSSSP